MSNPTDPNPNDSTEIIASPKRKRPVWRRWYIVTPAAVLTGVIVLSVALGGGSHAATSASPPAPPASSAPAAPDREATVAGCKALLHWENTYDGPDTADASPIVDGIRTGAAHTKFGDDLAAWLDDTGTGSVDKALTDAGKVHADCAAVGVDVLGDSSVTPPADPSSLASQAPVPAPTHTKPAVTETSAERKVLFKVTGTGDPSIQYGSDSDTRDGGGHLGALGEGNPLPWSATLPYTDGQLYWDVTAQLEGYGDITATVSLVTVHHFSDGTSKAETQLLKSAHASGGYNIAMAEAMG